MVNRGGTTRRPATGLAAIVLIFAVSGCAKTSPSASSLPSASALSSPSASIILTFEPSATAAQTPGFEAPVGVLPPNSRAVVTLDGLRIREARGLSAAVVATLPANSVVEISGWWGPTVVDGIDWYYVFYDDGRSGYAAAAASGVRYLDLLPARCDQGKIDLAGLQRVTAWERLACLGDRSLTVTGTYGCPVCGEFVPGSYEPGWLASPENLNYLASSRDAAITLHFRPEAGLGPPPNASIVRVTGHFSDPTSNTCVIGPPDGEPGALVDHVVAELYCREQFVVDAYQIIGTDPGFTYPFGSPAP